MVDQSLYVDDCLCGADSIEEATSLQSELQDMFERGGFVLRKWNSNSPLVLEHIPTDLKDAKCLLPIPSPTEYTKTLGVEWCAAMDHFRLSVSSLPPPENLTKRSLISDIAKTYYVLGWFAPAIVKAKIMFQQLWELKLGWDDVVPASVKESWMRWRTELPLLSHHHVPRCHFPLEMEIVSTELHGFCDASELVYSGVVYLRFTDRTGNVHTSLVTSKTKVAPIKRQSIPRLELCGAQLLARLISHVQRIQQLKK